MRDSFAAQPWWAARNPYRMSKPNISVVIPTFGRPRFLREAIESALGSAAADVEVIVVPNGPDESWKAVAMEYSGDPRIGFFPIAIAHANRARNHGMRLATGTFIRFLDDDDLLSPGVSELQRRLMEDTGAEICSGAVDLIDEGGVVFRAWQQPPVADFIESILMPGRVTANLAHVFRREALNGLEWCVEVDLGQDTHWMHSLCREREWRWVRTNEVAGQWRHHSQARISSSAKVSRHLRVSSQFLMDTVDDLDRAHRLGSGRRAAAVAGLWKMAHSGFFLAPRYWWSVIRVIRRIAPGSFPDLAFYRWRIGRIVHPLLLETAMIPKRWGNHLLRRWRYRRGRLSQVLPP